ncbi:putative protein hflK, cofactor of ATP-dependent protease FtsH [Burkholderia pseudomallei]|nr:hypothetical protein DO73_5446 [Burkholderia pseudomallei]KGC71247.1 hypothetical protein DP56_6177 [Burkholderia pseudomallei]KGD24723.1 hypothetical protein DO70_5238 [Burkholderia pseudomallei]KGD31592.1 putative protein hflK, cofactor of ATP-dependent protease FtsH [Burkholderia pseudomallei]KGD44068.1 putative protein hflK, cofactor of ATP-dependent protease FtsH [Burkholderia pseudomallei]
MSIDASFTFASRTTLLRPISIERTCAVSTISCDSNGYGRRQWTPSPTEPLYWPKRSTTPVWPSWTMKMPLPR